MQKGYTPSIYYMYSMYVYVGQCELFSEEEEHLRQGVSMYVLRST